LAFDGLIFLGIVKKGEEEKSSPPESIL